MPRSKAHTTHEGRRDEILRVALGLFASKGIEGTGLREIAERIGVSQPALYHYFASKDALVDAVIEWRREDARGKQAAVTKRLAGARGLRQGLVVIAESLAHLWQSPENEDFHRLILSEITRQGPLAQRLQRDFIEPGLRWAEGLFSTLIKIGKVRDLDPSLLAVQFVGPLLVMGLWQRHHGGDSGRERFSQLLYQHLEVLIRGIERA
jgi:AcrR family transcriptional regulator